VISTGLQLIERNYLFTSALDAPRLLGSALTYAEARLPEVRSLDADGGAHVLAVGPCRLRLELSPQTSIHALAAPLEKAAGLIDRCVTDRPEGLPATESLLLNGVFSGLDPYSTVFDAQGKEEHAIQFQGSLAGIGARIGIRKEKLTLINVYPQSPAAGAGLRDGDFVRRIDGASTIHLPVNEAVQKIRGPAGTTVRLEIEREGTPETFSVEVRRNLVTIPSVQAKRLDGGVIYAEISHFSQTTPQDFRTHVASLIAEGEARGVIIDLRVNSGGSMLGSAAIADLFLDEGVLITTSGRDGTQVPGLTTEILATRDTPFRALPVAVLTSVRTASGSELMAASLRMHDRAVLVGERTFGKGTVQKTYALGPESSLKMTVGHFLPNGFAIPGRGLTPDVELRRYIFEDDGIVWPPADRGAQELPFWLQTPTWLRPAEGTTRAVLTSAESAKGEDDAPTSADDAIVALSAELLRRFGSISASATLDSASDWLAERAAGADAELAKAFTERGLDWRSAGAAGSALNRGGEGAKLAVSVKPKEGVLQAGSDSEVAVTVTNTGTVPFYRLYARLTSRARFLDGRGVLIGYLPPGASRVWTVRAKTPAAVHTSRFPVRLEVFDDSGYLMRSGVMQLATSGVPRPRLSHRVRVSSATDPSLLEIGLEVRNIGEGPAEDVRVFMEHPDSDALELVSATATTERLAPGETRTLALQARLLRSEAEPLKVKLLVSEGRFNTFYEASASLTGTVDAGSWQVAPSIRVERMLVDAEKGTYKLIATADDDEGLASVWCRVDGKKVDYIDARDEPRKDIRIELPWSPSDDGERIEITAVDGRGIRATYVTDL
jgi:carboxyl-terminal processing protease